MTLTSGNCLNGVWDWPIVLSIEASDVIGFPYTAFNNEAVKGVKSTPEYLILELAVLGAVSAFTVVYRDLTAEEGGRANYTIAPVVVGGMPSLGGYPRFAPWQVSVKDRDVLGVNAGIVVIGKDRMGVLIVLDDLPEIIPQHSARFHGAPKKGEPEGSPTVTCYL